MSEKIYLVRETQFGYTVEGPNGHKWVTTREDGWQRTVAFAKALERAFLEGQKSITSDTDLMVTFELIKTLGEETATSIDDLKARIRLITSKAAKVVSKLETARAANGRERIHRDGNGQAGEAPVSPSGVAVTDGHGVRVPGTGPMPRDVNPGS